jgi:transposase-like protein
LTLTGSYFLTKGAGMKKYRHFPLEYKQRIVHAIESGLRSRAEVVRTEKIASSLIDRWIQQMQEGTLLDHPSARERQLEKELERYKKKVGELTLENDLLKKIDEYSRRLRKSNGYVVTGRNTAESRKDVLL